MTTTEIKPGTRTGMDEILAAVSNFDLEELNQFVDKVLTLRAKRVASNLSGEETALLKKINRGLSPDMKKRLSLLEAKRSDETMTEGEQKEMMDIVEALEQLNFERVQYLDELALMRGIPVRELMKQLGIRPKPYA